MTEHTANTSAATSDGSIEIQVVGAIRLALEASANDETMLSLIVWLVAQAPATLASDTGSVRVFIEGIRAVGGSVSSESPSGAYTS